MKIVKGHMTVLLFSSLTVYEKHKKGSDKLLIISSLVDLLNFSQLLLGENHRVSFLSIADEPS